MALDPNISNDTPLEEGTSILVPAEDIPMETKGVADAGIRKTPLVKKIGTYTDPLHRPAPTTNYTDALVQPQLNPNLTGTGSPQTDAYAGSVLGIKDALDNNKPVYQAVTEATEKVESDPFAGSNIYYQMLDFVNKQIKENMWDASALGLEGRTQLAKVANELSQWQKLASNQFGGFEMAFTPQLANNVAAIALTNGEIAKEQAYQQMGYAVSAKFYDSTGWLDTFGDFLRTGIGVSTATTISEWGDRWGSNLIQDVKALAKGTYQAIKSASGKSEGYSQYMNTLDDFWKEDTETRMMLFSSVIEPHIQSIAGSNKFTYTSMISPFIEKETADELKLEYATDATIVGSFLFNKVRSPVSAYFKILNARKAVQLLLKSGNKDLAAQLLTDAIKERDLVKIAKGTGGMTKEEVAVSLNPINMQRQFPGQILGSGGAAIQRMDEEIVARMSLIDKGVADALSTSSKLEKDFFNDAARRVKMDKILGDLNSSKDVVSAHIIESTPDHFTVGIVRDPNFIPDLDRAAINAQKTALEQKLKDLQGDKLNLAERVSYYRKAGFKKEFIDDAVFDEMNQLDAATKRLNMELDIVNKRLKNAYPEPRYNVEQYNYSYNEMGEFNGAERIGTVESELKSPIHTVDRLAADQTADATITGFEEAKIASKLRATLAEARKGLTPNGTKRVDKILLAGDEAEKVFSIRELLDGVQTAHGIVKLKGADEVATYYASRRLADHLHGIKNQLRINDLKFNNYKEIRTGLAYDNGMPIKLFTKDSALQSSVPNGVERLFDMAENKVVNVRDLARLEERLKGEWKVARLRTAQEFGDEIINYAIIKPLDHMRTPSGYVLRYVDGYIPRLREGINYIVRQAVPKMIDGKLVKADIKSSESHKQVVRFFSSKSDAETWISRQDNPGAFEWDVDKRLKGTYEGKMADEEFESLNFGGSYDGQRTDRNILFGLDGTAASRRSAVASLDSYTQHVANRWASFDLKNSLVGRFMNTYKDYLTNPADWRSPLNSAGAKDQLLANTIETERTFISDMMRMPEPYTQWMNNRIRAVSEWMEGSSIFRGAPQRATMSLAGRDPIAALKTAGFHMYLGFWNISSLITQAFGTTVAMTAYPLKAAKLLPQSMAIRAAMIARNNPEAIEKIAQSAGIPGKWLGNIMEEMKKTNLMESLFTTGDFNQIAGGAGYTRQMLDKFLNMGQVMTKEGESWTRIYGYLLARDIFTKGKPALYKLSDSEIRQVVSDSFKYTLNLNRAARASYQKGVFGASTQFLQIMAKFGENLFSSSWKTGIKGTQQWTTAEKVKILLGHIVLFGSAGIPFFDSVLTAANNMHASYMNKSNSTNEVPYNLFDFTGLPPSVRDNFISGGAIDVITQLMVGTELDVSKRASIPFGLQEMIEMYQTGDKNLAEALAGASVPALVKLIDQAATAGKDTHILQNILSLIAINDVVGREPPPDIFTSETGWRVARDLAQVFSSTRNFDKAAWWNSLKYISDTKGQNMLGGLIDRQEQNAIIVAEALGLHSKKVRHAYLVKAELSDADRQAAQVEPRAEGVVAYMLKNIPTDGEPESVDRIKEFNYAVYEALVGLDEKYQVAVRTKILEKMTSKDKPQLVNWLTRYYMNKDHASQNTPNTFGNVTLGKMEEAPVNAN